MLNDVGDEVFDLSIDYISPDESSECGYSSLGVTGGEGAINIGDPDAILGVETSLSKNFNERGLCYNDDCADDEFCYDGNCVEVVID